MEKQEVDAMIENRLLHKEKDSTILKLSSENKEVIEKNTLLKKDIEKMYYDQELLKTELKQANEALKKTAEVKVVAPVELEDTATKEKTIILHNKIVAIMNADSQRSIESVKLEELLGRKPEKNETIGDLKLYKVYLTQKYKLDR